MSSSEDPDTISPGPGVAPGSTSSPSGRIAARGSFWAPKGLVAVLDANILIAARLSRATQPTVSHGIILQAGFTYDSFTSPSILTEVEDVLARPRFGYPLSQTRCWLDTFLRQSRQVDPQVVPGDYRTLVHGDAKDSHVLRTALAVDYYEEGQAAIAAARTLGDRRGCYIVSSDKHFTPGWNVWGWTFVRPEDFWRLIHY